MHKGSDSTFSKEYIPPPGGLYALVNEYSVIAELPFALYTITCSADDTLLFRIRGAEYRKYCGTFNAFLGREANSQLQFDGAKCKIHDVLLSEYGYNSLHHYVATECALENLLYFKTVSRYHDILQRMEEHYVEEYLHFKHLADMITMENAPTPAGTGELLTSEKGNKAQSKKETLGCQPMPSLNDIRTSSTRIQSVDDIVSLRMVSQSAAYAKQASAFAKSYKDDAKSINIDMSNLLLIVEEFCTDLRDNFVTEGSRFEVSTGCEWINHGDN